MNWDASLITTVVNTFTVGSVNPFACMPPWASPSTLHPRPTAHRVSRPAVTTGRPALSRRAQRTPVHHLSAILPRVTNYRRRGKSTATKPTTNRRFCKFHHSVRRGVYLCEYICVRFNKRKHFSHFSASLTSLLAPKEQISQQVSAGLQWGCSPLTPTWRLHQRNNPNNYMLK